jgi:hypothetical protein
MEPVDPIYIYIVIGIIAIAIFLTIKGISNRNEGKK